MTIKQQGGVFGRNPTFNDITVDGELAVPDDVRIKIGDGDDLVIYHNSSNNSSYIAETGSGNLLINGSSISFNNGAFTKTYMLATDGGSVQLRYNDDPKIETANTGVSITGNVIVNSGSGIDFSATAGTGTSELLDDYEEGIHTATLTPTTSGTIGLAGSANSLSYTKIGNMVNVTGYLYVSAISSPVGAINVSLPFAAADLTDGAGGSAAALSLTNIVSANVSDFVGRISETSSDLALYLGSSNNISAASAQQMQVGSQIQISVTYRTA